MKSIILKIVRIIAILPFVFLLFGICYYIIFGEKLIDETASLSTAVLLTIISYLYFFRWLWIICISVIIVTSIIIKKNKQG